jgi:hypothetical protein
MIDNLYRNATTKIKWKREFSEGFKIEQGVRQYGTLSADLLMITIRYNQYKCHEGMVGLDSLEYSGRRSLIT